MVAAAEEGQEQEERKAAAAAETAEAPSSSLAAVDGACKSLPVLLEAFQGYQEEKGPLQTAEASILVVQEGGRTFRDLDLDPLKTPQ